MSIFILIAFQEFWKHKKLSQHPQSQASWRLKTLWTTVQAIMGTLVIPQPLWEDLAHFLKERSDCWLLKPKMEHHYLPIFSHHTFIQQLPDPRLVPGSSCASLDCDWVLAQTTVAHETGYMTIYFKKLYGHLCFQSFSHGRPSKTQREYTLVDRVTK